MHPTTLMSCPRIHRRNRRRQTRTAIRDDQRQVLAFQPAAIQILEQAFPVGLTLSLTAQKRQQVTPAIAPHAVSHQHLYPLASRWTPHPQAHSIQEQVSIVIAQLGLVKLANRLVQIAGQFRDRLPAHHFAGQGAHSPPHLPRADPAQKCLPDQQRNLLRPPLKRLQTTGQKALLASTRNPQPDGAEAGHKIPLVVAVAIDSPSATPPFVPPPARIAIELPVRLTLEIPLTGLHQFLPASLPFGLPLLEVVRARRMGHRSVL